MPVEEVNVAEGRPLSSLLIMVAELVKDDYRLVAESFDLPVYLLRALVLLTTPLPMRDLAEQFGCDRSYVTLIADQLEERGLVERVPGTDRRFKLLSLTTEGAEIRRRVAQAIADRDVVMRKLDEAQRLTLRPLLEELLRDAVPAHTDDGLC